MLNSDRALVADVTFPERPAQSGCTTRHAPESNKEKIFVIDDDAYFREYIAELLIVAGWKVDVFSSCEQYISCYKARPNSCIVLDINFPGMGGLELLGRLGDMAGSPPAIFVSGGSGIAHAVQTMRQGAQDFIEKPVEPEVLCESVRRAFAQCGRVNKRSVVREAARDHLARLTPRQRQIVERILDGQPNKNIASDLGISQRTVENHRASIMERTGARSLPDLAQMVMCNRCALDR